MLYVDDDENLLDIVKIFLEENSNIRVDTAISVHDARIKLTSATYDAIVSDYEMPQMNGIEFLKYIRKKHGDLPFILFTGKGREEVVIQAINNGADFYLQKGGEPVSQFAELSHKIRQAVQQRRAEASILDHERREADIINFLPDATFAIDINGVVIAWNRAIAQMTGVEPSEILGKGNYEYAVPFYFENRPILIDLVLKDDPVAAARYPYIKRDGKNLFSEITIPHFNDGRGASLWFTASPLYDTGGAIVGAIESIRDVTARKRQEHILKTQLDLGLALQTTRGINATLDACLSAAIGISGMDSGGVYLVDEKTGSVDLVLSKNLGDEFLKSVSHYSPGSHNAEIVMAGKPIYVFFNRTGIIHTPAEEREGLRACAIVPILSGNRVTGCMNVASHTRDEITITARVALEMIATQTGNAIERIRSEEALFVSEQKYRNVVEDQTEFISRFLPDGTHVFVNDSYCRYFNKTPEELIGHRFMPDIPVEDRQSVADHFRSLTPENPVATIIHRIILPDGSLRWHRWSDRAIFNKNNVLTEYQSVGRDFTDLKQAEELLRKREAELRSMLDATPVGVALLVNRMFQRVNQSLCTMTGYAEKEMIGLNTRILYTDDAAHLQVGKNIYDQLDRAGKGTGEARLRKKDGTIIDVMLTLSPFDPANLEAGVTATVLDITDRKRAEEALILSEKNYRSVIENLQDCFYKSDREGNLILASPSFARFLGYESVDVLYGKSIAEMVWFWPELRKKLLDEIARHGFVTSYPVTLKKRDGTPVYVEVSSHRYHDDLGGISGVEGTFRDVTEHRQAEEALRESETKFRTLFESAGDAIFIMNSTVFLDCNHSTEVIYSCSRDQIIGHSPAEFSPERQPDGRLSTEKAKEKIDAALSGEPQFFEWVHVRYDRTPFKAEVSLSRIMLKGNYYLQAIVRDVTKRSQVEEALRESEELYRTLAEASNDIIFVVNRDDVVEYVNSFASAIVHTPVNQIIGAPRSSLFSDEVTMHQKIALKKVFETGSSYRSEGTMTVDGHVHWFDHVLTPLKDPDGHVRSVLGISRDVTERRKAEEALRESEEKYRLLIERASEAILIAQDGIIQFGNPRLSRILGISFEKLIGKPFADFIHPDDREMVMYRHKKRIEGETIDDSYDFRIINPEGRIIWVSLTATRIDWNSRPATLNLLTDITERKRAEESLQQVNRQLNLMTSITRHDLLNKIMAMRSYLVVAKKKSQTEEMQALIEKLESVTKAMKSQIEFTRVYQDLGTHEPQWQDTARIVEGLEVPSSVILESDIRGIEIFADPLLEKVFYNLLDNSLRHGGDVTRISLSCRQKPPGLVLVFEDNGTGIRPADKDQIFNRGFGKNNGLGLFLVREILTITDITIRETGTEGQGARFEILVPEGKYRCMAHRQT